MTDRAPRLLPRPSPCFTRGAWLLLSFWLAVLVPGVAAAQQITWARFVSPTDHYDHGILGDAIEFSGLEVRVSNGRSTRFRFLPGTRVFEDIAPRLWDVTGDGAPEVVVIETDPPLGAQLAIYGLRDGSVVKLAATPHIGQTHRWLAPIAAADLDGDGHIEIAYIDRPHLAKTLRIWRYKDGTLTQVAAAQGHTNHKIGWDFIAGGLRFCRGVPELITADAKWRRVIASRFDGTTITGRDIGSYINPASLNPDSCN